MKIYKFLGVATLLFICLHSFSQTNSTSNKFKIYEDSLKNYGYVIQNDTIESNRVQANYKFIKTLVRCLKTDSSFNYTFPELKNVFSLITSDDNQFRIFTWFVMTNDGTFRHYGALQKNNLKKLELYPFTDIFKKVETPEDSVFNATNWFGAVYYNMTKVFDKTSGKNYYTLLGWKGVSRESSSKVIETLYFENAKPTFGLPVFIKGKTTFKRILFNYNSNASMLLKFESEKKDIVFDHLVAPNAHLENMPTLYAPDLSYDAYSLKVGKWYYKENVDIKNEPDGQEEFYIDPKDMQNVQTPIRQY